MLRSSALLRQSAAKGYDVVVSGGGLVGASMMAALIRVRETLKAKETSQGGDKETSDFGIFSSKLEKLLLVDQAPRPRYDATNIMHNLRTVSITPVSSKILDNLGCWKRLETKHAYYRMALRHEQVNGPNCEEYNRSTSFFMSSVLGSKPTTEPVLEFVTLDRPLGFICYNSEVNARMLDIVEDSGAAELRFKENLDHVVLPGTGKESSVIDGALGKATLRPATAPQPGGNASATATNAECESILFSLLLGCEGRGTPLRSVVETGAVQHDYNQTGFVVSVRLERPEDGNVCAFQNFFRDGKIIGFLPTSTDTANIVFSTTPSHARQLYAMTQEELVKELNSRLHDFAPRDIPKIVEIPQATSPDGSIRRANGSFPLKLNVASTPCAPRCILLGDAAHGIHPMAGQGLNLGMYDVCALSEIVESAVVAGHDVGSLTAVGHKFAGEMFAHTVPMITAMEGIKTMMNVAPGFSCLGMKALEKLPIASTYGKEGIVHVASGGLFASRHRKNILLS